MEDIKTEFDGWLLSKEGFDAMRGLASGFETSEVYADEECLQDFMHEDYSFKDNEFIAYSRDINNWEPNMEEGEPFDEYALEELERIVDGEHGDYNFSVDNALALAKEDGKDNLKYYTLHPKNWMFAEHVRIDLYTTSKNKLLGFSLSVD